MEKNIDTLLAKYEDYITNDYIEDNEFNEEYNIILLKQNIDKFRKFIDKIEKNESIMKKIKFNETYIYIRGLYYICNKEYAKMVELFKGKKNPHMYNLLSYYYMYINRNDYNVIKYSKKSIALGNNIGYYILGIYYRKTNNIYLMKKYLKKAIDLGIIYAANRLTNFYTYVENNKNIAIKYIDIGMEYKNPYSIIQYAEYYIKLIDKGDSLQNGNNGFAKSKYIDLVINYYKKAIELDNVIAMNGLGYFYDHYIKNYSMAEKYYLMAIENGLSIAMVNLGSYYANIEKNIYYAKKYYIDAANKYNILAFNNLCNLYEYRIEYLNTVINGLYTRLSWGGDMYLPILQKKIHKAQDKMLYYYYYTINYEYFSNIYFEDIGYYESMCKNYIYTDASYIYNDGPDKIIKNTKEKLLKYYTEIEKNPSIYNSYIYGINFIKYINIIHNQNIYIPYEIFNYIIETQFAKPILH